MTLARPNIISRRRFLSASTKAAMAAALGSLVDIPFVMKRALADGNIGLNGKKVLFIWLRGANDGLNSLIPIVDGQYATSRPNIHLPTDAIDYSATGPCDYPLSASDPASPDFPTYHYGNGIRLGNGFAALHPSLKFLAPVYNAGELALIHRVAYPKQSRSHFDSQRYWENGTPNNSLVNDGIFYRTIFESGLAHVRALTGVSIQSALPLILRGSGAAMTNLADPTRYNLLSIPSPTADAKTDAALFTANGYPFPPRMNRELLSLQYQNLQQTLGIFSGLDFSEGGNTYQDDEVTDNDTQWATANGGGYYLFPTTGDKNGGYRRPGGGTNAGKYVVSTGQQSFFKNLRAAALLLNKTDAIIAGTEFGGFDTHNNQVSAANAATGAHANLMSTVGWAIYGLRKYFTNHADQAPWSNVLVVTLSEFGRTSTENGNLGTDHAEASVMWVAGGGIKGYNKGNPSGVFNCHPDEFPGGTSEALNWFSGVNSASAMFGVANGYLKRNTDYRSVLGEIIRKHLGATQDQLNRIIPGYANPAEMLLSGGASFDGTKIRGEVGFL